MFDPTSSENRGSNAYLTSARFWAPLAAGALLCVGIFEGAGAISPNFARKNDLGAGGQPNHAAADSVARSISNVARTATPSVVSIRAIKTAGSEALILGGGHPSIPGMPNVPAPTPDSPSVGIGSGVIIREDGLILTNYHVVDRASQITVDLKEHDANSSKLRARIVGVDPRTDIAVIRLETPMKGLPVIKFANSDQVEVGDATIAIGTPFGLMHSVTSGIVSAKGRGQMGVYEIEDFLQTDAAINPGNSGGPLLNLNGEMIGLNSAIFSESGGSLGIGFSISSNLAKQVSDDLVKNGKVVRGWLGVIAQDLDPDLAKYFGTSSANGAVLARLEPGAPGDAAGLQVGDVVTSYDQRIVKNSADLRQWVGQTKPGTQLPIEIMRDGKLKRMQLVIREQPALPGADDPNPDSDHSVAGQLAGQVAPEVLLAHTLRDPLLGLSVRPLPETVAKEIGLTTEQGGAFVLKVKPGSPAFDAGISPGDIILRAENTVVRSSDDLEQAFKIAKTTQASGKAAAADRAAVLYVQRGPVARLFVPVHLIESN